MSTVLFSVSRHNGHTLKVLDTRPSPCICWRMSIFKKLVTQGPFASVRDENNVILKKVEMPPLATRNKRTWRASLKALTNDGEDLHVVLFNLAHGVPLVSRLPDGRECEPVIPSPEVRRAAAMDLLTLLHGKAVAQTEVMKAEIDAEEVARYAAMSADELFEAARPLLHAEMKRKELLGSASAESQESDAE